MIVRCTWAQVTRLEEHEDVGQLLTELTNPTLTQMNCQFNEIFCTSTENWIKNDKFEKL